MKQKWIEAFMDTAERFGKLSSAKRLKVGAVIVKDNRIISIGYNGTPAGWDNDCETIEWTKDNPELGSNNFVMRGWKWCPNKNAWYGTKTKPEVIHAESNAIAKLAKSNESGQDSIMFVTHAPCIECAKLVYQSGINSLYYRNSYRDESGLNFLEKAGIEVKKI